jgi:hypothetical protein
MKRLPKYIKEPSRRTPWIVMEQGKILILGRSILENPREFYRPVYDRVCNYVLNNGSKTKIEFGFEYINTSSTKWIYAIILKLSEVKELADNAKIIWYYEQGDEDMCELGFIFKSLVECPFFVVEVDGINKKSYEQIMSDAL